MGVVLQRVGDEAGLRSCQSVIAASFAADFELLPADPYDDIAVALTGVMNGEPIEYWIGVEGDRPVSAVVLRYSDRDNTDLVYVQVDVVPDDRGRGVGRETAAAAVDLVRSMGRTRISTEVPLRTKTADPSPGVRLADSLGVERQLTNRRRVLRLGELGERELRSLDGRVGGATAGYSLISWRNHTPVEWANDMAQLIALMSTDPPQGDAQFEAEEWSADRYREWEQSVRDRHRDRLVVAARDDATGRLVAFTDLTIPDGRAIGYQWTTIVAAAHRGHRLGLALKIANLRHLLAARPDVTVLNTWNAVVNEHMVSVNELMGFEPMEDWVDVVLTLD